MKVYLNYIGSGFFIPVPDKVIEELDLCEGDSLELDIPMTGGPSLVIHKVTEQRTGEEVV